MAIRADARKTGKAFSTSPASMSKLITLRSLKSRPTSPSGISFLMTSKLLEDSNASSKVSHGR